MDEMEQWKFQQMVDNVDFLLQKIESLQEQIYKLEDNVETLGTKVCEWESDKPEKYFPYQYLPKVPGAGPL